MFGLGEDSEEALPPVHRHRLQTSPGGLERDLPVSDPHRAAVQGIQKPVRLGRDEVHDARLQGLLGRDAPAFHDRLLEPLGIAAPLLREGPDVGGRVLLRLLSSRCHPLPSPRSRPGVQRRGSSQAPSRRRGRPRRGRARRSRRGRRRARPRPRRARARRGSPVRSGASRRRALRECRSGSRPRGARSGRSPRGRRPRTRPRPARSPPPPRASGPPAPRPPRRPPRSGRTAAGAR